MSSGRSGRQGRRAATAVRPMAVAMVLAAVGLTANSQGARAKGPVAAPEWEKTIVKIDIGQDRKGRPRSAEIACRLPQRCRYVRGVIVAGSFGDKPAVQEAAARVSMGIMQGRVHARSGKEALKNIDAALDKWAEASGHPADRSRCGHGRPPNPLRALSMRNCGVGLS